jgi:formate hydrogenlyase subunit 6/NADH:ubiquinone oxidoreductase subunit I
LKAYIANIKDTITTFSQGFKLTMRHLFDARTMRDPIGIKDDKYFDKQEGIVTLQYPFEELPVPDNGRYQLHNEIDDCIVCDKCAKVCPVNCIDIEPVRAVEEIGKTSDGTPKRIYAAKFDIDMAKCCFCGLCTTVCPTECLTMTKEFDFSVFDIKEHNFVFGEMTEGEIAEKKDVLEKFNEQKLKDKEAQATSVEIVLETEKSSEERKSAVFRPKVKSSSSEVESTKKPVFKPKIKSVSAEEGEKSAKPVFRPKIKSKEEESSEGKTAKPVFRPKIKLKVESEETAIEGHEDEKPKTPAFRPKIKEKSEISEENKLKGEEISDEEKKLKKPVFRPKIKPKK